MADQIPKEIESKINDALAELNRWVHSQCGASQIATNVIGITDVSIGITELHIRVAINPAPTPPPPTGEEKAAPPEDVAKVVGDLIATSMAAAKAKGQPVQEAKPKSKRKPKGDSDVSK